MTQAQLDRAIASVTGESRRLIARLGFSLANPWSHSGDPEPADVAKFLDWDRVADRRFAQVGVY